MAHTEIFEAVMMICFGIAWPVSIMHMLKTKKAEGKSYFFLFIILTGYLSGIMHKIYVSPDAVIYLYILNCIMVITDIILTFKYRRKPATGNL
jgi:hypothetical protein